MLQKAWIRFKSEVPGWVRKIQIVLGMAGASLTTAAAINWPGKLATVGSACGYGAAVCAAVVLGLQFIQQTVTVFETTTEVTATVTQTTSVTEQPAKQDN